MTTYKSLKLGLGCILTTAVTSFFLLGCSEDPDGGSKNPPPGKYTDYSDKNSVVELGAEIPQNEFYRFQAQADISYCKDGSSSLDPQVTASTQVQVLRTSKSAARTESLLENHNLGFLDSEQLQFNSVLLKADISDFKGAVASQNPMTTQTCTKKTSNGHSTSECGNFKSNWTAEYLRYFMNRTPEVDEPSGSCKITLGDSSFPRRYYAVKMTTASGIRIQAFRLDSVDKLTVQCEGKNPVIYQLENQAIYSPDLVDTPHGYICTGFNQVQKTTRIRDLDGQIVREKKEEVLDAPLRVTHPL